MINKNISEENEIDNDSFIAEGGEILTDYEYDNKLTTIKYNIMKIRLEILIDIIYHKIKIHFIHFIIKSNLKFKMERQFAKNDNFLYIFPNVPLNKFNHHYAFKRLVYSIKSYKYRQNFLINNYFSLWKTNTIIHTITIVNNLQKTTKKKISNLMAFTTTLDRIILQRRLKAAFVKLVNIMWFTKAHNNEILLSKFIRANIILMNIFNKRISFFFNLLPRNFALVKSYNDKMRNFIIKEKDSDKKVIDKAIEQFRKEKRIYRDLKRKNILMKILVKLNLKYCVDRRIYIAFEKIRSKLEKNEKIKSEGKKLIDSIIDLKCNSLINGSIMLNLIFNRKIYCDLIIYKREFFDRIIQKVKIMNTLIEYAHKYKKIPEMVSPKVKTELLIIRRQYQKVFALEKIIMLRVNHKVNSTINDITYIKALISKTFLKWKEMIVKKENKREINKIYIQILIRKLNMIIVLKYYNLFYSNLIMFTYNKNKIITKNINNVYIENFLCIIRNIFNKHKMLILYKLKCFNNKNPLYLKKTKLLSIKIIYSLYRRYNHKTPLQKKILLWKEKTKEEHNTTFSFFRQYSPLKNSSLNVNKLSSILKIIYKISYLYLRKKFTQWIIHSKDNYKKNKKTSVEPLIIKNMTIILKEYENEDNKFIQEITKLKKIISIQKSLMHLIMNKHFNILYRFFFVWKYKAEKKQYKEQHEENENGNDEIKNESDALLNAYYEKKSQYKKTIYDYEYMKKHCCNECIGESLTIDYKSIDDNENENDNESEKGINTIENDSCMVVDSNEDYHSNKIGGNNGENKITDKENLIKEYQKEYNEQLKYYEDVITTMQKKKEELLELKSIYLNK